MSKFTLILHDAQDPSEQGRQALKNQLHSKLNLPVEALEEMFSTLPVIIKQDLNQDQANSYLDVFQKLGAMVELLPDPEELNRLAFEESTQPEQQKQQPEQQATENFQTQEIQSSQAQNFQEFSVETIDSNPDDDWDTLNEALGLGLEAEPEVLATNSEVASLSAEPDESIVNPHFAAELATQQLASKLEAQQEIPASPEASNHLTVETADLNQALGVETQQEAPVLAEVNDHLETELNQSLGLEAQLEAPVSAEVNDHLEAELNQSLGLEAQQEVQSVEAEKDSLLLNENLLNGETSASDQDTLDNLTAELEAELGQLEGFDFGGSEGTESAPIDSTTANNGLTLSQPKEQAVQPTQAAPVQAEPVQQNVVQAKTIAAPPINSAAAQPAKAETTQAEQVIETAQAKTEEAPKDDHSFDLSSLRFEDDEDELDAEIVETASPEVPQSAATQPVADPDTQDLMGELEQQLMAFSPESTEDISLAQNTAPEASSTSPKTPDPVATEVEQTQDIVPQSTFPSEALAALAQEEVVAGESSNPATEQKRTEAINQESDKKTSSAFRRPTPEESLNEGSPLVEPIEVVSTSKGIGKNGIAAGLGALLLLGGAGFYFLKPAAPEPALQLNQRSVELLLESQRQAIAKSKKKKKKGGAAFEEQAEISKPVVLAGWKVEQKVGSLNLLVKIKADEKTGRIVEMETLIKQDPSKKLTKKELVNGVQREAWIRRFETSLERPKKKPKDIEPTTIVTKGYAYLEDGKGTGRSDVTFSLKPKFDKATEALMGTWELKSANSEEYDQGNVKRLGNDFELFFKGEFVAEKTTVSGSRKPAPAPEEDPKPATSKNLPPKVKDISNQ